ncbi:permease-like cell division protein FtsX [Niveibacterium sp. 24ML]|uniref:permease-like cell division protein FtsX n=1 Tax=Niveibacterium sp. 24ML TaxID=2985512 RepID=UPI00226F5132|nr:permease-like cell division protein FtsX [Niveibacterium sp. 24ML]MCX9155557.1 permease-like cell division protein FtsX [Niveibacterium sp. 24ML]
MTRWLALHGLALTRSVQRLAHTPLGTVLSVLVVAIALVLPALGYVLADSVARLAQGLSGRPEISLFMAVGADKAQVAAVEKALRAEDAVAGLRFVAREDALKQLASGAGLGELAQTLGENPLPDAFIVTPRSDAPAEFERLSSAFRNLPGVAHVQLDTAWVQRLAAVVSLVHTAVGALAGLLGAALVIVTFNTIRLQILTQRHEIGVSLLLGATQQWVRRPFLWFGALQGALGGLTAWGLLLGILALMRGPATQLAESYGIPLELSGPDLLGVLALIGFAALLGWLGAALSVRRHLHAAGERGDG